MKARLLASVLVGIATVCYPFAVYFGIHYFEPWHIAAALATLLCVRVLLSPYRGGQTGPLFLVVVLAYCIITAWHNEIATLRLYPVVVNAMMLLLFGWSLWSPPTAIERLARLQHPDLPPQGVRYTRRVTQVWCGFFAVNGTIALATAMWADFETWALYNGFIAYLLMALLFVVEYLVRRRTQGHVQ